MKNWRFLMLAGLLTACSGGEKPVGDDDDDDDVAGDDDDDVGDDDDDDDTGTPTDDSGTFPLDTIDPLAVGFEYDGVLRSNGALEGYVVEGYGDVDPYMILKFADLALFEAGGDEDTDVCFAFGQFQPQPGASLVTHNGAELYYAYETALTFEFSDCPGFADPAIWGPNAENLLDPFFGAHFGYGFGELTQYLRDAFGPKPLDPEVENGLFGGYIAINDAAGNWVAYDWTIQYAFEWDETTREPLADEDGFLIYMDISGIVPPDPLPDMYVRSASYWYQDFIYMDFDNLQD